MKWLLAVSSCVPLLGRKGPRPFLKCDPAPWLQWVGWGGPESLGPRWSSKLGRWRLPSAPWAGRAKGTEAQKQKEADIKSRERETEHPATFPSLLPVLSEVPLDPCSGVPWDLLCPYKRAEFSGLAWLELASIICRDRQGKLYLQTQQHRLLPSPSWRLGNAALRLSNQLVQPFSNWFSQDSRLCEINGCHSTDPHTRERAILGQVSWDISGLAKWNWFLKTENTSNFKFMLYISHTLMKLHGRKPKTFQTYTISTSPAKEEKGFSPRDFSEPLEALCIVTLWRGWENAALLIVI